MLTLPTVSYFAAVLAVIIAIYVYFNMRKMHKFTKVAYFILIFAVLATIINQNTFALILYVLCILMGIMRLFGIKQNMPEGNNQETKKQKQVVENEDSQISQV